MKYDFIRGHMGGNIIVLLHGNQFQPAQELEQAVKILGPHYLAGHEAGLLYASAGGADLAVKIAEPVSKCFISACGGLTQVLGKALVETGLGRTYGIRIAEPVTEVVLKTGAGHVKIGVETSAGKAGRVWSNMQSFIREIYAGGVGPVEIKGIPVFHAGKFMVVNADRVREVQPQVDFYSWDSSARELISALQEEFMRRTGETEYNCVLYDWHPSHQGDLRVVYPHCVSQEFFEPSCGTGSVAAAIAVFESGELLRYKGFKSGETTVRLEAGGGIELGGPDLTELLLTAAEGRVADLTFSHSLVEITAAGEVWLPDDLPVAVGS